jgi:hypothetical protein
MLERLELGVSPTKLAEDRRGALGVLARSHPVRPPRRPSPSRLHEVGRVGAVEVERVVGVEEAGSSAASGIAGYRCGRQGLRRG